MRPIRVVLLFSFFLLLCVPFVRAQEWAVSDQFSVAVERLGAYSEKDASAKPVFWLYRGMSFSSISMESDEVGGAWARIPAGGQFFWVPAVRNGVPQITLVNHDSVGVFDMYGILQQPHQYALKMVKKPGAKGVLETYKKVGGLYLFQHAYAITYPKDGPKSLYGDLKTVGGPVIRYVYRTTRSGMNGVDKEGRPFGVYKVSYPMPHDALPYLLDGAMGVGSYNNIPAINKVDGQFEPHPHSMLGADILIHTSKKGSLGCINVPHEEMSFLYREDVVSDSDHELIPLVIYDENSEAPPQGFLF